VISQEKKIDVPADKETGKDTRDQVPDSVFKKRGFKKPVSKKTAKELANEAREKKAADKAEKQAESLADAYVEKPRLNPDSIGKTLLDRMPSPTGWRILILPYQGRRKTAGGIFLPNETVEKSQISTQVGYVLKVGPLAYKDTAKFPTGAWCKEKQWVMFARYAGSRFQIDGGEVRILNDDEILSTILDPEDIHQLN
jgi:co-chaperonin GroES (HSP10)|tara:strand:- start:1376 stop:1966 length:591 start_codon:yes stop_codon:yes gene_type:complete